MQHVVMMTYAADGDESDVIASSFRRHHSHELCSRQHVAHEHTEPSSDVTHNRL